MEMPFTVQVNNCRIVTWSAHTTSKVSDSGEISNTGWQWLEEVTMKAVMNMYYAKELT